MSYLRIDPAFMQHRKFDGWTPALRWAWLELMGWMAERGNGSGRIPDDLSALPRSVTPGLIERALVSGWIDEHEDGLYVHDWIAYNGATVQRRVAAYLDAHPQATANQVADVVGGRRQFVLKLVREYRGQSKSAGAK